MIPSPTRLLAIPPTPMFTRAAPRRPPLRDTAPVQHIEVMEVMRALVWVRMDLGGGAITLGLSLRVRGIGGTPSPTADRV